MPTASATIPPSATAVRSNGCRVLLVLATVAALALSAGFAPAGPVTDTPPDLLRLLRFMALLKGVFALLALAGCFWRLARPATPWREAIYVTGPGLMAGGALSLWQLHSAGLGAAVLHFGLFALLAAALTDEAFIPASRRRRT